MNLRDHHDIVEQGADDASEDLHEKGTARRDMHILRKSEVLGQHLSHLEGVICVASEVQI
jgi:hypothetical protein